MSKSNPAVYDVVIKPSLGKPARTLASRLTRDEAAAYIRGYNISHNFRDIATIEGETMTENESNAVLGKAITTHRSDEMTIIRRVAALRQESLKYEVWSGSNSVGWRATRSEFFNRGAAAIMAEHGIDDLGLWHWFCDRANEMTR